MKFNVRTIVKFLLVVVLMIGVAGIVRQQLEYRRGAQDAAQAAELVGAPAPSVTPTPPAVSVPPAVSAPEAPPAQSVPEPPPVEEDPNVTALRQTDLPALQAVNSEVMGWIWIPGSELSYPLLQAVNNDYYLSHNWKHGYSALGSIFLDYRNAIDLRDFNNLVYGHRMRDDSMFGSLKHYKEQSYWEQHPSIYLLEGENVRRYDIFAAYEAEVTERVYTPGLTEEEQQEEVISLALDKTVIDTGIVPTTDDHLLTLVTCTGRGYADRWLVQAVEIIQEG